MKAVPACILFFIHTQSASMDADSRALVPYTQPTIGKNCVAQLIGHHVATRKIPKIACSSKNSEWKVGDTTAFVGNRKTNFFEEELAELAIQQSVRAWHHYTPKSADKMSLMVIIHGTNAADAGWYRETNHDHFQGFLKHAETLAENNNSAVDVISFGWTGKNSIEDRIIASITLANLLNRIGERYEMIQLFGHSHGGSIAQATSNQVAIPVELNLFATPMRNTNAHLDEREQLFSPGKTVTAVYNIYSTGDVLQTLGSIRSGFSAEDISKTAYSIFSPGSSRRIDTTNSSNQPRYNIEIKINGASPSHQEIRLCLPYLYAIKQQMRTMPSNSDFDAQIITQNSTCAIAPHVPTTTLDTQSWLIRRFWRLIDTARATTKTIQTAFHKNQQGHCEEAVATIA